MKRVWGIVAAVALAGPAMANDTAAQLAAGGLEFVRNDNIRMVSEDLYLSMEAVQVDYVFENLSAADQHVLVAFPMPDLANGWYEMIAVPTEDPENVFGFSTLFDGEPVEATLHQYAFALGVDRTKELLKLGLPLAPHLWSTIEAIAALSAEDREALAALGLINSEVYYDGDAVVDAYYYPNWTLRSAYVWEAVFPAGEIVSVSHSYMPSVGGTTGVTFLYEDGSTLDEYRATYCLDDDIVATLRNSLSNADEPWSAPYMENWLTYVLSTGANWAGPIESFRLVVDKGSEDNLVSFCGENVEKIGPTTFEMTAENFYPSRDIDLLFLVRYEPEF